MKQIWQGELVDSLGHTCVLRVLLDDNQTFVEERTPHPLDGPEVGEGWKECEDFDLSYEALECAVRAVLTRAETCDYWRNNDAGIDHEERWCGRCKRCLDTGHLETEGA